MNLNISQVYFSNEKLESDSGDFSKEKSLEKLKEISGENIARILIVEFFWETQFILKMGNSREFFHESFLEKPREFQDRNLEGIFLDEY